MPHCVVFLRAINVGGHSVKKDTLLEVFESLGFHDAATFKQSGNVILEANELGPEAIKQRVEAKLREVLGYDVTAFVYTIPQLKQLISFDPFKGCKETGADFQVTFLAKAEEPFPLKLPVRIPNSTADVISARGGEVFSVTRGHGDGGKPNPFLEAKLKLRATTRNWNVICGIIERYNKT